MLEIGNRRQQVIILKGKQTNKVNKSIYFLLCIISNPAAILSNYANILLFKCEQ